MRFSLVCSLIGACCLSPLARAGELGPAPDAGAPASSAVGQGEASASSLTPADSPDFELLPKERAPTLNPDAEVGRRRSLLQWHQALGIATTLLMVGTVITGQLNFSDRYGGGGSTGRYEIWHTSFEAVTVSTFAADALLALFAPTPFPKRTHGVDTITVHKYAMLLAALGFASEIPLGIYTVSQEGHINQSTFATAHLVIGYVTAAALLTGVAALLF